MSNYYVENLKAYFKHAKTGEGTSKLPEVLTEEFVTELKDRADGSVTYPLKDSASKFNISANTFRRYLKAYEELYVIPHSEQVTLTESNDSDVDIKEVLDNTLSVTAEDDLAGKDEALKLALAEIQQLKSKNDLLYVDLKDSNAKYDDLYSKHTALTKECVMAKRELEEVNTLMNQVRESHRDLVLTSNDLKDTIMQIQKDKVKLQDERDALKSELADSKNQYSKYVEALKDIEFVATGLQKLSILHFMKVGKEHLAKMVKVIQSVLEVDKE